MTLAKIPSYDDTVTMVPSSGIQFLDFRLDLVGYSGALLFLEEETAEEGRVATPLTRREGELRHPDTDEFRTRPGNLISLALSSPSWIPECRSLS
jgi:hypothetical protein